MDIKAIEGAATVLADKIDADVVLYNGPIERGYDSLFLDLCDKNQSRTNVLLILCTYGGDADAAFRIARFLQHSYQSFTVLIPGFCKSAGTLLAIGAHEIVMADHGELGPLDVQLGKKDEIWETDSGLTVLTAITKLEEKCFDLFETSFLRLKQRSGGRITLRTATELASKLAVGTISPIVSQIDPMHVGVVSRAMNIGLEYGDRLSEKSENLKRSSDPDEDALQRLTNGYPSHEFVIDRYEAETLFENVREPNEDEKEFLVLLGTTSRSPARGTPHIYYLSKAKEEAANESCNEGNVAGVAPADSAGVPGVAEAAPDDGGTNVTKLREAASSGRGSL